MRVAALLLFLVSTDAAYVAPMRITASRRAGVAVLAQHASVPSYKLRQSFLDAKQAGFTSRAAILSFVRKSIEQNCGPADEAEECSLEPEQLQTYLQKLDTSFFPDGFSDESVSRVPPGARLRIA